MSDVRTVTSPGAGAVELTPASYFEPLNFWEIFPRPAPLEIDLGCGDGTYLVELAEKFPDHNFLGIERLLRRVRSACGKAARRHLPNVRVLRIESSYAVAYLLPRNCATAIHLLFPDPWPKKRHHRRRVVTKDFLAATHRALAPRGCFRFATDQVDYFQSVRGLISAAGFAESELDPDEPFPLTTFEKHFAAQGAPIYRLELRKV